jgi:hypothetical protein
VGLAPLVASTDLLATVPERLARIIVELVPARIYELPIPVPDYSVMQYWHTRSDRKPLPGGCERSSWSLFQRS